MVYKRFRVNLVLRVALLVLSIALFFYLLFRSHLFAALFITGLTIIFQIFSLTHYVESTNRDLARFFQSIKYGDFTQSFKDDRMGPSFSELRSTFTDVANAFRKTRAEKEEHYRWLQTVVQHVGVGLIAFQPSGDVELINNALKKQLRLAHLKNINNLETLSPELVRTLFRMKPRERALVRVEHDDELMVLSLYATEFKLRGQKFSLISIQNIHKEIEETEIEAWQKIIRVLTHEIMNSITPISSLASTINELVQNSLGDCRENPSNPDPELIEDVLQALQTIQKRSQGLMHFVDAYRNTTLIPKPKFQPISVSDLLNRVGKLMQANIRGRKILFRIQIEPDGLEMSADPELLEQVLINLLLNALQSVENQKEARIDLAARLDNMGRIILQVRDNGPGISRENLDKIFIPFYSTKEGGSGIGLSLSRQIMRLHNGTINAYSNPESETVFTLRF